MAGLRKVMSFRRGQGDIAYSDKPASAVLDDFLQGDEGSRYAVEAMTGNDDTLIVVLRPERGR